MNTKQSQVEVVNPVLQRRSSAIAGVSLMASIGDLVLSGCTGMVNTALTGTQPGVQFAGSIHGGQQPVSGAKIQLYAAQATGYGSASVGLLATNPTSASDGTFSFSGFTCPAAPNDQVYLVATGGNSGSGVNANLSMMTALGACSNITTSTFVQVNEVTTVAAAYALSGFMTDYQHVATSSTNYTGLKNAFATVANLSDYTTGQALAVTPAYSTAPAGTTTATFRSTVPQAEINTLANIVSACVNTNGVGGSAPLCSQLFSATTPTSGTAPTDTIQAALNIAKSPGKNVSTLFGLSTAQAPFAPSLATAPSDWTVAVNYIGGGLGGPATPISQDASSSDLAIDAGGNVWISNFRSSKVTELSPVGAPITTSTVLTPSVITGGFGGGGLSNPNAIAIDNSGNAWMANSNGTISELTNNGSAIGTGFSGGGLSGTAKGIAIDAANNVWVTSSVVSEFDTNGNAISTASGFTSSISSPTGAIAVDGQNNVWVVNGGNAEVVKLANASGLPLYTSVPSLTSATAYGSVDASNQFWVPQGSPNSNIELFNSGSTVPTAFTPGSASNVVSTSIDGLGFVWLVNAGGANSIAANVTELSSTGSVISPGSTGYQGTGTSLITSPRGSGVDLSGNLWISNGINLSTVTEFVGIGAPTITPLAAAAKSNKIGTRP